MALIVEQRLALAREHVRHNRRVAAARRRATRTVAGFAKQRAAELLLAVTLLKRGGHAAAGPLLRSVRAKWPGEREAIGLLAVVHRAKGELPGAIACFEDLIELGPETADLHNHIGACQLDMGDAVAAGNSFKRAIELDRNLPHSYYNLGMALKLAGNSFETFSTFRRAIELNPTFLDGYLQLWQQMRHLLNWDEGLPILEDSLRRHPDSVQMMLIVAAAYGKVGRSEDAEALFMRALEREPAAGPPYAHWLQEEGRFEDSVPVLQDAIVTTPIQGQAYYNLAVAKCFEAGAVLSST